MLDKPDNRPEKTISPELLARFAAIVGEKFAITDPQSQTPYLVEMRDLFRGHTPVVLRPGSVAEVSAILKLANETGTPIVPQGGNTGLVGGQIPHHNEIVLSVNRLDRIREVDPASNTITVESGVTLQRTREAAAASRPALSAIAAVGRHLHHRRQSLDQCRRHGGAGARHRALARARARSGAGRRPRAQQSQQAEKRQYRLRSEKPVHRRRRHARHHHRRGVAAGAASALDRDRLCRRRLAGSGA